MIDRRELLAKARERKLNLNIVEKDYVLGWLLWGCSQFDSLVFKGGTALSKIYFPEIWRLSEDLDFSLLDDDFSLISDTVEEMFKQVEKKSGIKLVLKSRFSNPDYLQLKIQYHGVISRNWIKADFMKNDIVDNPVKKYLKKEYSDYEKVDITVESLEEIFCSKVRTVIERKKCRDFFDLWKLINMSVDIKKVKKILSNKLEIKGIKLVSLKQIFAEDLKETLFPYWERELGRLVNPLPELEIVLTELKSFIKARFI
ncbi:MAG: nucleotidyl transferase AbiEii/AbiGii toxin family protein [Candidatus Aminicenantes bacterium]|nr:nucleotidyl transferase AbiEii/AbiGii toxin family protein [Candidatus Aminicenantes bacterium]